MLLNIDYAELFRSVPPHIATMLISMLPVAELRAAVPIAIHSYKLSITQTMVWSVLGSVIPPILFIFFLDKVSKFLSAHFLFWRKFFIWLFEHARKKSQEKIENYGAAGVLIIAAIPIPILGGGWTAALAAFVFGIEKKKSIPALILGTIIMGIIILLMTLGTKQAQNI